MKFLAVAALAVALVGCSGRVTPLQILGEVPQFELVSQDGQPFDSRTLAGKIWVADFIYTTCPGPCPRMTSQMREVQDAVSKIPDVRIVSFTVDPTVTASSPTQSGAAASRFVSVGRPKRSSRLLRIEV